MITHLAKIATAKLLALSFFSLALFAIVMACCGNTTAHAHAMSGGHTPGGLNQSQMVCPYTGVPKNAACATHIHGTPTAPLPETQESKTVERETDDTQSTTPVVSWSSFSSISQEDTVVIFPDDFSHREAPKVRLHSSLPRSHIIS